VQRYFWLAAILPAACALAIGSPDPAATNVSPTSPTTTRQDEPLAVQYVFSPTCEKCKAAGKVVDAVAARLTQQIRVERLNILDPDALDRVMALEDRYRVKAAAPPRVFVGSQCLTGLEQISEQLDAVVAAELKLKSKLNRPAASQPDGKPASQPH
jgi:hypothetical protein